MAIMLQEGIDLIAETLADIYEIFLSHQTIPQAWREVKVVFIPKQGRPDFTLVISFRPISLTSFLLKAMERLVDRFIRDNLKINLNKHQYAYQSGKSCEAALHHLVGKIEEALDKKQLALGFFMDIEGAFNCVSVDSIVTAALEHEVHPTLVGWIKSMLSLRYVRAERNGATVNAIVNRGCPQGGVLSPLLWCLVVNNLILVLQNEGFYVQAYADDVVVLIRGKFVKTVFELGQGALHMIDQWCRNHNLAVNPAKTVVVPFTKKRNLSEAIQLTLRGEPLKLSSFVKYLGVILDKRLSWKDHLEAKIDKAMAAFWVCRRAIGPNWGLTPKVLHWIYTTMVRPILSYACVVWWPRLEFDSDQKKLRHLQATACRSILGAMKTSPILALEVLCGIPPLHMYLKFEAMNAAYRLHSIGMWQNFNATKSHSSIWKTLIDICPSAEMLSDFVAPKWNFEQSWSHLIPSREEWTDIVINQNPSDKDLWFTDGSRIAEKSGAGIYCADRSHQISISLGRFATVFQAEVYAILGCTQILLSEAHKGKIIHIYSDSQAAIKAINNPKYNSKLVSECKVSLNKLGLLNKVAIIWVPGHCGIEGNEMADQLARLGSELTPITPEPVIGIPKCTVKTSLNNQLADSFRALWHSSFGMRQSKLMISGPSQKFNRFLLSQNKRVCHTMTGLLTGHCKLRKHLYLLGLADSALCRLCQEEEETPSHLIGSCPALDQSRWCFFGVTSFTPEELKDISPSKLLKFFQSIKIIRDSYH